MADDAQEQEPPHRVPYWEKGTPEGYFKGWANIYNANELWAEIRAKQEVRRVEPLDPSTPLREGHTRFVCMSDTHHIITRIDPSSLPRGDVLLHAGDITSDGSLEELRAFDEWMARVDEGFRHKIVIGGNHDMILDETYHTLFNQADLEEYRALSIKRPYTYLLNETISVNGFKIFGSPMTSHFWGVFSLHQDDMEQHWERCPTNVDILLTHGPPLGHGDYNKDGPEQGQRLGDPALLRQVEDRIKPKYHVFGHVHEAYGCTTNGVTTFVNASTVDIDYCSSDVSTREKALETADPARANPFIVFDLPNKLKPPIPPFTQATATQKVRMAEDAWNSRDPSRVVQVYTTDTRWRNRNEFFTGREEVHAFLTRKWASEKEYRLIKEIWCFDQNKIAVRFAYEYTNEQGQWFRAYGNENWEFDEYGLMQRRYASINDLAISQEERKFNWPLGRRPDDYPSLSELGL